MLSTPDDGWAIGHMLCVRRWNLSMTLITSLAALTRWLMVTSLEAWSCWRLSEASSCECLVSSFSCSYSARSGFEIGMRKGGLLRVVGMLAVGGGI